MVIGLALDLIKQSEKPALLLLNKTVSSKTSPNYCR
jgi:hypothetical protein